MLPEMILAVAVGYDAPLDLPEVTCLAEALYFEARDQPVLGIAAVAVTVINRKDSFRFPDTYCGVIYQSKQFSYTSSSPKDRAEAIQTMNVRDAAAMDLCIQVALQAAAGGFDGLHTALHYYNPKKANPSWAKSFTQSFDIGDHKWVY